MLTIERLLVTFALSKGSCADIITHRNIQSVPCHEDSTHRTTLVLNVLRLNTIRHGPFSAYAYN
jgi:hypothetical protein